MTFNLVLPEVLPRAKFFAAFFAGILHASLALLFRGSTICYVVANEPLCYPYQAIVVAGRLYMDICVVTEMQLIETLQQAICLHLFCMCRNISPDDVCSVRIEIPWCDKYNVAVPYPHPSLYLASDPACPYLAIGTFYNDVVASDQLDHAA
jgi:hypothetical protein